MFGIGATELVVIFLIILLLFGAKRLPEIARSMGKSFNEFKNAKNDFLNSVEESASISEKKTAQVENKPQTPTQKIDS